MKSYFFLLLAWLSLAGGGAFAQRQSQRGLPLRRSAQPTLLARAGTGANFDRVEYFLDADPGVGAATSVPLGAPGNDLSSLSFAVPLGSLNPGLHRLGVRSRDLDSKWSTTAYQRFYYETTTLAGNIDEVEYFLDTDPGVGNAANASITPGQNLSSVAFTVNMSSVATGFHRLWVRSHDAGTGHWSLTALQQFYYQPPTVLAAGNIDRVEYFLDEDPGVGSGTAVSITPGANLPSVAFAVNMSSVAQGFHRLWVRSHDAGSGHWSLTALQQFYYQPPTTLAAGNIDRVEYFLDTDPGVGNATAASITPGTNLPSVAFAVNLSSVAQGFHRLWVRSHDAGSGHWSLTALQQFYYQPPTVLAAGNINRIEYFLDEDPGVGSGTAVSISPGQNLPSVSFAVNLNSIAKGVHRLYVRSRDAGSGRWSLTANRYFFAEVVPALANINKVEYFVDADPGVGLGTNVPVGSPAPNLSSFPFVIDITSLSAGTHRLYVRSRDANGKWALTRYSDFIRPATTTPAITSFTPMVGTGGTVVTITGTNFLGATGVTFNGVAGTGFIVNSTTSITVTAPAGGSTGQLCVVAPAGTGCSNAGQNFTYIPVVTGISPAILCAGSAVNVTFTATGYAVGNTFTAQLSNTSGSFTAGFVDLGTLNGSGGGTINGMVPAGATASVNYRIRVVANNPAATGAANGSPLTLQNLSAVAATSNSPVQTTGTIQLNVTGAPAGATFAWTGPGTFSNASLQNPTVSNATTANSGTYQVVVTSTAGCAVTRTVNVTVNPAVVITLGTVSPVSYCAGGNITVPFTVAGGPPTSGNVFTLQLSNSSGSFLSGVTSLGTITGTTSSSFTRAIPAGTAAGTQYRVRIMGSTPSSTSANNGTNLTITAPFTATATAVSQTVNVGDPIALGVSGAPAGASYAWSGPNSFSSALASPGIASATLAANGTYSLTVTNGACVSTSSVYVRVTDCSGTPTNIGAGLPAANYSQVGVYQTSTSQSAWNGGGWNASGYSGSMTVDLGAPATLTRLDLKPTPSPTSSVSIQVQVSSNMTNWTNVATISGTFAQGAPAVNERSLNFGAAPLTNVRGIRLVASYGNSWVSITNVRAYVCPVPYITSFTPTAGPSGTSVVITGGNFTGATGVTFNGTAASGFVVNNAGQITVSAPANGSTGPIAVTTMGGTGVSATNYTYQLSLSTGTVSSAGFCAGAAVSVPFTVTNGSLNAGNVFTAQLSNASGTFASGVTTLGTLSGTTSGTINGTIPAATATSALYRIRVIANQPATTGTDNGSNLSIDNYSTTTASSNTPITAGATLQLNVNNAPAGSTFAWTGPNSFSSSQQNPQLANTTTAASGTYSVTVTGPGGCSVVRTTNVTVNPQAATVTSIAPATLCAGASISITFAANSYQAANDFTAQLSNASGSFASGVSNLGILSNTTSGGTITGTLPAAANGTSYRIRIISNSPSIVGPDNGSNLTITNLSATTATSNGPLTAGATLQLNANNAPAGSTYAWTGPNSFSSSLQNPQIANTTTAAAGTYSVLITTTGNCSITRTVSVTINPVAAMVTSVTPTVLCTGASASITFTATGYQPGNDFSAQLSNASGSFASGTTYLGVLSNTTSGGTLTVTVPSVASGSTYRVRIYSNSPAITGPDNGTNLTITNLSATTATSNGPLTAGATLQLNANNAPAGSTYAWTGPNSFSSSLQNPQLANTTTAASGTYSVLITSPGNCTITRTVNVTVNPVAPVVTSITPAVLCAGGSISITFDATGYQATNDFTAQLSNAAGSFASGVSNLGSLQNSTSGGTITATLPTAANGTAYRVRVISNTPTLIGAANGTNLTITNLSTVAAVSNSPVANGGTIQLNVNNAPAGATFAWTGPDSFSSTLQNPQIAGATTATNGGAYQVVVTAAGGCSVTRTVNVTVNAPTTTITTGIVTPATYCAGDNVSVPFTKTGTFTAGNVFTAQLSNTSGSFASGVQTLGTLSGTAAGTISGTIPVGTPTGTLYRIRVVGSQPITMGTSNAANLTITNLSTVTATSNSPVATAGTISLSVNNAPAGATFAWTGPGTFSNASAQNPTVSNATTANSGTYQVVVTSNGCQVTRTTNVTVNPPVATATITTTGPSSGTYCAGSPIYVDFTTSGTFVGSNVFTAQLSNVGTTTFAGNAPVIGTVNGAGMGSGQIGGALPGGLAAGQYYVRVISSNPAVNGSVAGPITVSATSFTWTGGVDSNWNNAANWSCGVVPGATDDVTINPGGHAPIVGVGGAFVRSIHISLNATLTVNTTFTIGGDLWNEGTVGAGSGSGWVWAGGPGQVYGGGVVNFWNVTVNNTVNLTVNQNITVRGNVQNGGSLTQPWNYYLYLPGNSSFSGNPMTWGTYYVQPGGSTNWNTGITAWGLYNGGSINPGTSGFTFGPGGGGGGSSAGSVSGPNAVPFYNVVFNNPAGVDVATDLELYHFWTNNYVFNPGTRKVTFKGPNTVIDGISTIFYDIVIDITADVTLNVDITVLGDWENRNQFDHNHRRVIFGGINQRIRGTVITNFFDITFNNTVNLTLNQNIIVEGDFVNDGNFEGNGWYSLFGGSTAQSVGGSGSTHFGTVRWNNPAGITLGSPIRVGGDFALLGGLWSAGGYPVTFDGAATQSILGPGTPVFAGLVNNNGSATGLTLGTNIRARGNLSGTGRFCGCGYETWFDGTTAGQTISGPGLWVFYNVRINNTINLTLNVDIHVTGHWYCDGPFDPNGYTVYFDGVINQLIHGPVITNFFHIVINNTLNVTLNQTIRVRGNFSGPGRFTGGPWFTIFDGTAAQTINCTGPVRFGHLTFNNPSGVGLLSGIGLTGNFLNSAGFGGGGQTVGFYGTGTQSVNGAGIVFGSVATFPGASVSLGVPVAFTGNLTNNGAWLANNHACTFQGISIIGGAVAPEFYHVWIDLNASVTLAVCINLRGDFRNHGTFAPASWCTTFRGTTPQRIYGNAVVFNFYDIVVNTLAVVNVEVNLHLKHDLVNDGTINWLLHLVTCDGTTPQNLGGSSTTRFHHLTCHNSAGVSLGHACDITGDFRDLAGWNAGPYLTTFNGSGAQGIYGLVGGNTSFGGLTFNNGAGVTLFGPIGLTGDFRNTSGFGAGGYGVTFRGNGVQQCYGAAGTTFHHLIIDVAAILHLNLDLRLTGNWTNRNQFVHNNWHVFFNGTVAQYIYGPAITNFYHVTFNNLVGVNLAVDIRVRGNFVNHGIYCGCGFRTTFDGPAAQTITCSSGNTRFHHVTFSNPTGVTLLDNIGVRGNWVNDGGFLANGNLVLFDGTGSQTIGGTALTTFHGWQNTNNTAGGGVNLLRDVAFTGDFTNNGRYCGCGFRSSFVGTTPQGLTCSTGQTNFHHITLGNTSGAGVTLTGNINVYGHWLVTGFWNPQAWTVFFLGTGAQTIAVGGAITQGIFHGITIGNTSGAGVTLNCPLVVRGNWANNGKFDGGNYTVFANGTSPQTFGGSSPTRFWNWTIQNPTGVSCTGTGGNATQPALGIQRVLTMATGSGNLDCGGKLTLLSDADGTAMVVNQPGGGACVGRATMERFIAGLGAPGYRHYSSPMQMGTATVQEFADDLPVFELNPAYNTSPTPNRVTPFPTLYKYDETRLTSTFPLFDRGFMTPLATDFMVPGQGFTAQTLPTTTVDISGVLNNGSVSMSLTRGGQLSSGWNLVGNPYPAPIDWENVPAATGVDRALYVFVPSGRYTGTYRTYVPGTGGQPGVGTNGGTKDVAAMQGFFVRATAPTATLAMTNAVRHTSYVNPAFSRPAPVPGVPATPRTLIRLAARNATGGSDEAVVYFQAGADLNFNTAYDAYKMQVNGSGLPTLWSEAGTSAFVINGLPELASAPTIPLGVRVSQNGTHRIVATELLNLPAGTAVWLEDRVLNRRHNLAQDSSYTFQMNTTYTGQRFFLWFQPAVPTATRLALDARTALYPNPTKGLATLELTGLREQGNVQIDVLNTLGQVVRTAALRPRAGVITQPLDLRELPSGVYTVRVHTAEGMVVKRLVRE